MPRDISSGHASESGAGRRENEGSDTLGDFLRCERLKAQRTLDEESKATGVPAIYLEALEDNAFENLPPPIYVRGYLAAFARALGLSPDGLLIRFEEAFREHQRMREEASGSIFGLFSPPGEKFQWRDWSVPLGLAAGILAFSLLSQYLPGKEQAVRTVEGEHIPRAPAAAKEPPPRSRAAPATEDFERAAVRVVLRAEAVTRVTVERDGGGVEEWSLLAGETRYLSADREIVLSLGNAGAVRLNYNGRELGFIGGKGEVKRAVRFAAEKER